MIYTFLATGATRSYYFGHPTLRILFQKKYPSSYGVVVSKQYFSLKRSFHNNLEVFSSDEKYISGCILLVIHLSGDMYFQRFRVMAILLRFLL